MNVNDTDELDQLPGSFIHERDEKNQLRSNLFSENDIDSWIREFSILSSTSWNVKFRKYASRYVCRKIFICHHSGFKRVDPSNNKKGKSKNTKCQAEIDILVKLSTTDTKKKDKFVKNGLPAVINMKNSHNHAVDTAEALSSLKPSQAIRDIFEQYFNNGCSITEAMNLHKLELEFADFEKEMDNANLYPKYRTVRFWYDTWTKNNLGPCTGLGLIQKKKHKKRYESSSSDSGSSVEEMRWVEAPAPKSFDTKHKKKDKKLKTEDSSSSSESDFSNSDMKKDNSSSDISKKRESWMNEETFVPTLNKDEMSSVTSSRQKRIDAMREQRERDNKIQAERELNPHWKNDGTGLPEKEASIESLSLPSTSVGDGGYSWLKKAYIRIQEQSQREGRSMEDIAVERWGSLEKLVSLIEEAEARMKSRPDSESNFVRDKYEKNYERTTSIRFRKPEEYHSQHSSKVSFEYKKPRDNQNKDQKLNQFKSLKKSNYYDQYENRTKDSKTKAGVKPKDLNQNSSIKAKDHFPAWKKPKYTESKVGKQSTVIKLEEENQEKIVEAEANEIPTMYSEDDLNKLAAQKMRAELMGDSSLASKLGKQLEEARNIVKEKGFAKPSQQTEEVILTKFNDRGLAHEIKLSGDKVSDYKRRKSNKYFDDGSSYSLKQMFEREKMTTVDDQMEMFVEASAKCDDSAEIDFELGNVSKKLSQKMATGREEEKDIGKAIRQHQKLNAALEKCIYCLDQPNVKKYLIVDIGEQVYLSLPTFQTITEGHCLIVPKSHVHSLLFLDENEWREVEEFKSHLRNLWRSQNKSVIFLETSMNFRYHQHAVLECIPVPEEEGDMAPLYFKKAIQESEAEWSHNKKLVDLKDKGLHHSVPKNLPYFHVEFDPKVHAGYAHVIEEEKYFPHNFGKEVIGGMLDINYNHLYKNKKEDPLKKSKEVVEFQHMWKVFKTEASED